jgi:hypothetical protein
MRRVLSHLLWRRAWIAASLAVSGLVAMPGSAGATRSTFDYTAAAQQFTVPAGVTAVTVEASGAAGGAGQFAGPAGGAGGRTTATIAVTPGELLTIVVGGAGADGDDGGAGGFNGGATARGISRVGGGGGGATDVRQGGDDPADRVVVAGGGGGGGSSSQAGNTGIGGAGGGLVGEDGADGSGSGRGIGGGGGTQAGPGAGGHTGAGIDGEPGQLDPPGPGGAGGDAAGGGAGGGGGGGYYGGGGGGGGEGSALFFGSPAGGGGGSSFAIASATDVSHDQGARSGDGRVVLTYTVTPTLTTSASPGVAIGNPVSSTATLAGGDDPAGRITFRLYRRDDATCSGSTAYSKRVTVSGNGDYASGDFTPTRRGTYRWTASYSGDSGNQQVATACNDPGTSVTVGPADPTLSTSASPDTTLGNPIFDTATLAGGHIPTGTITFRLYGRNDTTCSNGPRYSKRVTVSGNGDYGSGNFTPTRRGTYRWTASYSGDSNNAPATTACNDPGESVTVS